MGKSDVKILAEAGVNLYAIKPLTAEEVGGDEHFDKREQKFKVCCNPGCGQTEEALGQKMKKCVACRSVRYCGRECQTQHWRAHKKFCKKPLC